MSKKVVIVSTTPRKNGNSEILATEFMKGAVDNGNDVRMIKVREMDLKFCKGCFSCQKTNKCVIKDDFTKEMLYDICKADVLVFATPVYYYESSGQLKTFIDRMKPLFNVKQNIHDIYIIATAAENEVRTFKGVKEDIKGYIDCYDDKKIKGTLFAGGVNNVGEVKTHKTYMKKAYDMGHKIK